MLFFGKNKNSESTVTGTSGSGQDSKAVVASIITDELKKLVVMKFSDKASLSEHETESKIPLTDNVIFSLVNQCTNGELEKRINAFMKGKAKIASLTISKDTMKKIRELVQNEEFKNALNMSGSVAQVGCLAVMIVAVAKLSKINGEMVNLNQSVSQISDFLETEYEGKLQTSIKEIRRFTSFQSETIKNMDLRNRELQNLKEIEKDCLNQINQANMSINKVMESPKKYFASYVNYTEQIEKWFNYQQILLLLLLKISELTHTLNLGAVSLENSYWNYNLTVPEVEAVRGKVRDWHKNNIEHYNVDLEKGYHIKSSKVHDAAKFIPISTIKDALVTEKVPASMIEMIAHQTKETDVPVNKLPDDPYEKDVNLIVDEGKLYFIPG